MCDRGAMDRGQAALPRRRCTARSLGGRGGALDRLGQGLRPGSSTTLWSWASSWTLSIGLVCGGLKWARWIHPFARARQPRVLLGARCPAQGHDGGDDQWPQVVVVGALRITLGGRPREMARPETATMQTVVEERGCPGPFDGVEVVLPGGVGDLPGEPASSARSRLRPVNSPRRTTRRRAPCAGRRCRHDRGPSPEVT